MKCFQCGEVGHKKVTCPHGRRAAGSTGAEGVEGSAGGTKPAWGRSAGAAASSAADDSDAAVPAARVPVAAAPAAAAVVPVAAVVLVDSGPVAVGPVGPGPEPAQPAPAAEGPTVVRGAKVPSAAPVSEYLARQEKRSEEQVVIEKVLVANPEQGMQCGSAQQAEQIQAELDSSQVSEMDVEKDYEPDNLSLAESVSISTDLYSLKEVNEFLDESFGKAVEVAEYFPDINKFIQTVSTLQKE
ncbi:unnamed protein product, partial [Pleuronectes platessa]